MREGEHRKLAEKVSVLSPRLVLIWISLGERTLAYLLGERRPEGGERMQRLEMENSGKMKMPLAAYNMLRGATTKWGFQKSKSRRRGAGLPAYRFESDESAVAVLFRDCKKKKKEMRT